MSETSEQVSRWYTAQIKRNAFMQAERSLTKYGVHVFAPKLERQVVRYGKKRAIKSLLFPSYIFLDGSDPQRLWAAVRATAGLARLVLSSSREPAVAPRDFIAELLARCDTTGRILRSEELASGDTVSVISGPFAGIVTRIEQVDEQERVWILLELLGSDRRIALKREHLVKLAAI